MSCRFSVYTYSQAASRHSQWGGSVIRGSAGARERSTTRAIRRACDGQEATASREGYRKDWQCTHAGSKLKLTSHALCPGSPTPLSDSLLSTYSISHALHFDPHLGRKGSHQEARPHIFGRQDPHRRHRSSLLCLPRPRQVELQWDQWSYRLRVGIEWWLVESRGFGGESSAWKSAPCSS